MLCEPPCNQVNQFVGKTAPPRARRQYSRDTGPRSPHIVEGLFSDRLLEGEHILGRPVVMIVPVDLAGVEGNGLKNLARW